MDLGQLHDPTTIAVVEQISAQVHENIVAQLTRQGSYGLERLEAIETAKPRTQYNIRLLEQAPLGEPYPAQAARLKRILARQAIAEHDPHVWIDYTGVGRAVFDIFRELNVPHVVPVTITFAGEAGPNGRGGHSVPKIELVSKLQALMQPGVLHMPDALPLAKVFRRELLDFRVSYTAIGNATFFDRISIDLVTVCRELHLICEARIQIGEKRLCGLRAASANHPRANQLSSYGPRLLNWSPLFASLPHKP